MYETGFYADGFYPLGFYSEETETPTQPHQIAVIDRTYFDDYDYRLIIDNE